jgi:hypothetical protein
MELFIYSQVTGCWGDAAQNSFFLALVRSAHGVQTVGVAGKLE